MINKDMISPILLYRKTLIINAFLSYRSHENLMHSLLSVACKPIDSDYMLAGAGLAQSINDNSSTNAIAFISLLYLPPNICAQKHEYEYS